MMSLTIVLPDAIIKVNIIERMAFLGNQADACLEGGGMVVATAPFPCYIQTQHHGST